MASFVPPLATHSTSAKRICSCGTTILFPGGTTDRTCWQCGFKHRRGDLAAPVGTRSSNQSRAPQDSHFAAQMSSVTPSHSHLLAQPIPPAVAPPRQSHANSNSIPQSDVRNGLLWVLLLASVLLNVVFFTWQKASRTSEHQDRHPQQFQPTRGVQHAGATLHKDTDGDGVPDKDDFCPGSKERDWKSGRATDFDADGCADGTSEDKDKDNDGILDKYDGCPFTPQKYDFRSNAHSDFDGDGCADGLEDHDDDNDTIPNVVDHCPWTVEGQQSDGVGCSQIQRETPPPDTSIGRHDQQKPSEPSAEPVSSFRAWVTLIGEQGLQVILGAILSAVLGQVHGVATSLSEQMPASPTDSFRKMNNAATTVASAGAVPASTESESKWHSSFEFVRSHGVRILGYLLVVHLTRKNTSCDALAASFLANGTDTST